MLKSSSYTLFRSFATATEPLVIERHITFLYFISLHFSLPPPWFPDDYRMATIIRLSFWHHLFIIGSSVIPINGIVPFVFQKGSITLAASILFRHDACFEAFLTAYLPWECATALYHGWQPYLTVTTSFQTSFMLFFLRSHIVFPLQR